MFWNLFRKQEEISMPQFISLIPCNEFINSTILLDLMNEKDFNIAINNKLKLVEIKNLDIYKLRKDNISVRLNLFLIDKKDNSTNHDDYRAGCMIGKIDASKLYLLSINNVQIFGALGLQSNNRDFIINNSLSKYHELKFEIKEEPETLNNDCIKFLSFFSKIINVMSSIEKSKLLRSDVSFVIIQDDPKNQYLSFLKPNISDAFFTLEILSETVRFTSVLDLEMSWNKYLNALNLKTYNVEEDIFIDFYCSKKGIDITKWASENQHKVLMVLNAEEFLNQAQVTFQETHKLIKSIEKKDIVITSQIKAYLLHMKQKNDSIKYSTEADTIYFYAKRYISQFEELCRPLSQIDKSTLPEWEVIVTAS